MSTSNHKRQRTVLQPPCQNDTSLLNITDAQRPLPQLPEELMVEILSRLPVKPLGQFCCVSKHWNSLISASDFIKYHLHRSATEFLHHRLLGSDVSGIGLRFSRSLRSLIDNPSPSPPLFDENPQFKILYFCTMIVGSCNGLICWLNYFREKEYHNIRYLNPLTRVESESPCFHHPKGDLTCFTVFGFGYDHVSDRYKTVAIYCDPKAKKTIARVYTLGGENCWRKIKSFPFLPRWSSASYTDRCGKFVSGTLNWLATNPNDRGSLIVASVDIRNETCVEILLPSVVEKLQLNARPKLWVLGGCLCFSYNYNDIHFVLWQMKVHGLTDSWSKLITISYMDFGMDHCFHKYPRPFFMLENGEILLQINHHGAFIIYNPRLNSFQSLWLESDNIIFEGTTHIESLVSPCPIH
ncbi:unnamed protein product [Lupinus luteus]|uniref:F-box domain-containing protein n=1 Tax=Lupinus luteus TaxID=3873 RepID=A0AAV1WHG7_LUPLU